MSGASEAPSEVTTASTSNPAVSASPHVGRWRHRLRSLAPSSWPDAVIVVALLALFCFVHRKLEAIEIGGDAISKWQFVRQWSYANDFAHEKWDHHMARMGVNALTWVVQTIFGRNWRAYYVGPFFMAAVQLPFVYALAKRFGGRLGGVIAALLLIYLDAVHRSASQLLPDGFCGTYAIVATYLLARSIEARPDRRLYFLIASALFAFVGYLAKETFVFFYPGFGLAVLLARRSLKDVLVFCAVLLGGLGLETLAYRLFTDYPHRIAIIRGTHVGASDPEPLVLTTEGLLAPFERLAPDWQRLLVLALLGATWLLFRNRTSKAQGRAVALVGLSLVSSLTITTQIWQRALPRYMDPVAPLAAVAAGVAVAVAVLHLVGLAQRLRLPRPALLLKYCPAARPAVTAAWSVAVVLVAAALTYRQQKNDPPFDGWEQGQYIARLAANAYNRNLPIASPARGGKLLMTVYEAYLSDLKLARDGVLPSYDSSKRRTNKLVYIVQDPNAYNRRVMENLEAAGCVLLLRRGAAGPARRGYVDTRSRDLLPDRCDDVLAKARR